MPPGARTDRSKFDCWVSCDTFARFRNAGQTKEAAAQRVRAVLRDSPKFKEKLKRDGTVAAESYIEGHIRYAGAQGFFLPS